jgi:hypothetical protein
LSPPLLGLILAAVAGTTTANPAWRRTHRPGGARRLLATLWPWFLGADLLAWLTLLPGVVLVGHLIGADAIPAAFVYTAIGCALGFMLRAVVAAFAQAAEQRPGPAGRTAGWKERSA